MKSNWDKEILEETIKVWSALAEDLSSLSDITFLREVNTEEPLKLYIFCDASLYVYGFVVYALLVGKSPILFTKCKVEPLKPKSIPKMELLAVFIAVKSLSTTLKSYSNAMIKNICIMVDAQVVLSWLLCKTSKIKNLMGRNRLKYIQHMKDRFEDDHKKRDEI